MAYYILNINYQGKSAVDYWLDERGIAPIFYGQTTLAQLKAEKEHGLKPQAFVDAKRFVQTFTEVNENAIVFTIGEDNIYIFRQKGPLCEKGQHENDLVKGFEVEMIKKIKINSIPLVLTSIKANRHISSGTFRDLSGASYFGNRSALEFLLTGKQVVVNSYAEYLQCLSSLEFETLIAKFLEEKGVFVPAYKGGFIKNFDLFCKNLSTHSIHVGKMVIEPKGILSIQIKLNLKKEHLLRAVDVYFCIHSEIQDPRVYDWKFLEREIIPDGITEKWLRTTLDWVVLK